MTSRPKLQRTSGGLVAVEEIPKKFIKARIILFISSSPYSCTKLQNLEDKIFYYCSFKHRGKNKEAMLVKIWDCVDDMLKQGVLIQYFSKKTTMVKINSDQNSKE